MLAKTQPIELRHIHYVVTAARMGSFRKASTRLGVRESTISRQIRSLEDSLGASLFLRRKSGVALTQAGIAFVEHAERALAEIDRAVADVGAMGRGHLGTIRIGLTSPLAKGFLARLLVRFSEQHRAVQMEFVEESHTQLLAYLERGDLDIAFMAVPSDVGNLTARELWSEDVYLVLPEGDVLAQQDEIEWSDVRGHNFLVTDATPGREIATFVFRQLASIGYSPTISRTRVSAQTLMQLIAMGQGISIAGHAIVDTSFPGVTYRRIQQCSIPFSGVWSNDNDNPAFRRLLSLAASATAGVGE